MGGNGGVRGAVEDDVLVDLVAEHVAFVGPEHVGEAVEIGRREDRARGVVRRVQHDEPRALADGRGESVPVDAETRRHERHVHGAAAREPDRGLVGIVGRIQHDGLVAGRHEGRDGAEQRLGRAGRDRDLRRRIGAHAEATLELLGDRRAQLLGTGHRRVLIPTGAHMPLDELDEPRGRLEIRKPL